MTKRASIQKNYSPKSMGNRLKLIRGDLSQREFATKIGVSLRAYQRYEHGERLPPFDIVYKISNTCEVNMHWIIKGEGVKEPEKDEFITAIESLRYILERAPFELVDFINKVIDLAISSFKLDVDEEEKSLQEKGNEFVKFLSSVANLIPEILQEFYESEKRYKGMLDELESESENNPNKD